MFKYFFLSVVITCFFAACHSNSENRNLETKSLDSLQPHPDSSEAKPADTLILENQPPQLKPLSGIDSFLIKPFNLYAFKSKKNGSLSGSVQFKSYHYKPAIEGKAYRFFMFEPKEVNYVSDGRAMRHSAAGYIGTNKKNISLKEDGLVIKTFQVNNKYVDKFLNPTEELIELTAKHNDFDLPELAFIGLDSSQIIQRLGSASFFQEHALVYSYRNLALIFKLEMGKVLWLRYIKLAKPVLKENLAKELFTLTNQNHLSER